MKALLIITLALGPFWLVQQRLADHRLYDYQQIGQVKHVVAGDQPGDITGSGHKQ